MRSIVCAAALVALIAGAATAAETAPAPPQPKDYWSGPMRGRTPGLDGATVVDAGALSALIATDKPVLLDVANADTKPPDMPADRWRPIHRSVPGSVWIPGAGQAVADAAVEARLAARVAELTGGRRDRPVVTFCHRDCWASWNVAKWLVRHGYSRVHWFSDGVEGWQEAYDPAVTIEDAGWASRPGHPGPG
jgi:PQQ-dependent catabolism-associated CXXCW motif protein